MTGARAMTVAHGRVFAFVYTTGPSGAWSDWGLRSFDLSTGRRLPWTPAVNLTYAVSLHVGPDESVIVYGLPFAAAFNVYRFDASSGALAWVAPGANVLAVDGATAYSVGVAGILRRDLSTGAETLWVTLGGGDSCGVCPQSHIALQNGRLYVTGNFATVSGVARNRAAAIDMATGEVLPWIAPGQDAPVVGVWADAQSDPDDVRPLLHPANAGRGRSGHGRADWNGKRNSWARSPM